MLVNIVTRSRARRPPDAKAQLPLGSSEKAWSGGGSVQSARLELALSKLAVTFAMSFKLGVPSVR